jgi:hypothetical protein
MNVRPSNLALTLCALLGGGLALAAPAATAGSINGVAGSMPAYYDHVLHTINFMRLTTAQATLLAKNGQQNTIYQSDPGLPGGQPFISVIDAIQRDGFNPLWAEQQIAFTAGHTPRQLFSDTEVLAAQASGEITLTPTNEMYRCSVIGTAPRSAGGSGAVRTSGAFRQVASQAAPASATAVSDRNIQSWGALKITFR